MHALLYRSTATGPVSDADIAQILDAAGRRNALWGICGVLVHGPGPGGRAGFVQWLEGDLESVEGLFAHICADARHTDVRRIAAGPTLHAPRFDGCTMHAAAVERLPETSAAFLACLPAAHLPGA